MGREVGKVLTIKNKMMTVQLRQDEHCRVCAAKSVCSFEGPSEKYRRIVVPYSKSHIREGDLIYLDYRESFRLLSAFIIFFLPLITMLLGFWISGYVSKSTLAGVTGAVIGLATSGVVVYFLNRWIAKTRLVLPKIIAQVAADKQPQAMKIFEELHR
jgi:positive regulator of sigma E activity